MRIISCDFSANGLHKDSWSDVSLTKYYSNIIKTDEKLSELDFICLTYPYFQNNINDVLKKVDDLKSQRLDFTIFVNEFEGTIQVLNKDVDAGDYNLLKSFAIPISITEFSELLIAKQITSGICKEVFTDDDYQKTGKFSSQSTWAMSYSTFLFNSYRLNGYNNYYILSDIINIDDNFYNSHDYVRAGFNTYEGMFLRQTNDNPTKSKEYRLKHSYPESVYFFPKDFSAKYVSSKRMIQSFLSHGIGKVFRAESKVLIYFLIPYPDNKNGNLFFKKRKSRVFECKSSFEFLFDKVDRTGKIIKRYKPDKFYNKTGYSKVPSIKQFKKEMSENLEGYDEEIERLKRDNPGVPIFIASMIMI